VIQVMSANFDSQSTNVHLANKKMIDSNQAARHLSRHPSHRLLKRTQPLRIRDARLASAGAANIISKLNFSRQSTSPAPAGGRRRHSPFTDESIHITHRARAPPRHQHDTSPLMPIAPPSVTAPQNGNLSRVPVDLLPELIRDPPAANHIPAGPLLPLASAELPLPVSQPQPEPVIPPPNSSETTQRPASTTTDSPQELVSSKIPNRPEHDRHGDGYLNKVILEATNQQSLDAAYRAVSQAARARTASKRPPRQTKTSSTVPRRITMISQIHMEDLQENLW
ncbi:hypothetical protein ADUPG1_003003, partial [Aduncisulcus paluster]